MRLPSPNTPSTSDTPLWLASPKCWPDRLTLVPYGPALGVIESTLGGASAVDEPPEPPKLAPPALLLEPPLAFVPATGASRSGPCS